ncbi:hypothetical protein JS533_001615 [Bifidobacterium amazonense]|uniref:PhnA protein n=1 Tax=Bifidobacterium amazonense TaxID=2809027 RepID=A0ABS9VSD7_9BIFI|nr:hypothetical protein [Bifidobacterium amazonense]MCH9274987.1 hypothetical protein [Bifidobacterium amazonense]
MNEHTTPITRFATNLSSLKTGYEPLAQIAMRKASLIRTTGTRASHETAPIPLNMGAWQLQQDIDKLAQAMSRAARLHPHHAMDTTDLLNGIIRNQHNLTKRHDFPALAELVDQAAARLERVLDPPPDTKMVGWCPQCGAELRCTMLEIAGGYTACERCRGEYKIREVQRAAMARLAVGGVRGTAAQIVRWLAPWGIDVRRNTVSQWARRGLLVPVGRDGDAPVYLVWDVWSVFTRRDRERGRTVTGI